MNPSKILCSVVIPTYNRSHTLARCIDSVLSQTEPVQEIIVVDDGSTDDTLKILNQYPEVTSISLATNHGVAYARNRGIEKAKHTWIAFLDSDDVWLPNKHANQVRILNQQPNLRIIQSNEQWVRNGQIKKQAKHQQKAAGWLWERALDYCVISASSALIHRDLFEQHGVFDEDLVSCEDFDLWLRITRTHQVGLDPNESIIKYGGASDQLSYQHPVIDRFRIYSLCKALHNEKCDKHISMLITSINKKIEIITKGSIKRGKHLRVKYLRELQTHLQQQDFVHALECARGLI